VSQEQASDALVVTLVRAGLEPRVVFDTIWPAQKPYPFETFLQVVRALEVADATTAPAEELPSDLEAVVDDLLEARGRIMAAIRNDADAREDGGFDAAAHVALCKNADAVLKYQAARQERQVHLLNLRASQERARIELHQLYDKAS